MKPNLEPEDLVLRHRQENVFALRWTSLLILIRGASLTSSIYVTVKNYC
jgi:hypothetical protein